MKVSIWMTAIALLVGAQAWSASGGTSAWGEEAREVYNTLIALGATRTDIPEGPTVIIDELGCMQSGSGTAQCTFSGDPKLKSTNGPSAVRMLKALVAMGVKTKTLPGNGVFVGVRALDCGILHNVNKNSVSAEDGQPSCYFEDMN